MSLHSAASVLRSIHTDRYEVVMIGITLQGGFYHYTGSIDDLESSEYSVSLHSAASVLRSIHTDRYEVVMIGITLQGGFYHYTGSIDDLEHDHWQNEEHAKPIAWVHGGMVERETNEMISLDCCLPILHGKNGEDGAIQGLLTLLGIPCVGCDLLGSAVCMDKEVMHRLFDQANIPAAPYICLHGEDPLMSADEVEKIIPLPWFIKPCNAGSSYGVHYVDNKEEYEQAVADAFKYDGRKKVLVEGAIDGFEIGCAVLGDEALVTGEIDEIEYEQAVADAFKYDGRKKVLVEGAIDGFEIGCAVLGDEALVTGEIDEIEMAGKIFDFAGKYEMKDSAIYCPARIKKEKSDAAKELAKKVFRVLCCRDMARVDMFINEKGEILVNEVNTIPGFTATSRYPSMMNAAGTEFGDLIDTLIDLAMQKEIQL